MESDARALVKSARWCRSESLRGVGGLQSEPSGCLRPGEIAICGEAPPSLLLLLLLFFFFIHCFLFIIMSLSSDRAKKSPDVSQRKDWQKADRQPLRQSVLLSSHSFFPFASFSFLLCECLGERCLSSITWCSSILGTTRMTRYLSLSSPSPTSSSCLGNIDGWSSLAAADRGGGMCDLL